MSYIAEAINFTRINEGGKSNNPLDRGGLTNMGITLDTLREASAKVHGHSFDKNSDGRIDGVDLSMLVGHDLEYIVVECGFWSSLLDSLPRGIAIKTFDLRFNMGVRSGTKILQKAVDQILSDSLTVDGFLGMKTITMANKIDQFLLYRTLVKCACEHYVNIAKYDYTQIGFVKGWVNRARRAPYPDPNFSLNVA